MKIKKTKVNGLTQYDVKFSSGLNATLIPMVNYSSTYVGYNIHHGNNMLAFKDPHLKKGIAHFLEHRLFDTEFGDAFDLFSKEGAFANAFTSYQNTVYYFSTTKNIYKCLDVLTSMVYNLTFDEKGVEKEKGIILEEYFNTLDQPYNYGYLSGIKKLYHSRTLTSDILGDEESIKSTTLEDLKYAHSTFYTLNNSRLIIVGKINLDEMLDYLNNIKFKNINSNIELNRDEVESYKKQSFKPLSIKMAITSEIFFRIYKLPASMLIKEYSIKELQFFSLILQDILFSKSSNFYQDILESGIVDSSFSIDFDILDQEMTLSFVGNTFNKKELMKKIDQYMSNLQTYLTKEDFELSSKAIFGSNIRRLGNVEELFFHTISSFAFDYCALESLTNMDWIDYNKLEGFAKKLIGANFIDVIIKKG